MQRVLKRKIGNAARAAVAAFGGLVLLAMPSGAGADASLVGELGRE